MSAAAPSQPLRKPKAWLSADSWVIKLITVLVLTVTVGVFGVLAGMWVVSRPLFALKTVRIDGDLTRYSQAELRAMVLPRLNGNFFTLNLTQARDVVEAVPWVRRAVVRRIWPNQLVVALEEHQPLAVWREQGLPDRLLSRLGEVFEANLGEVDNLPEFEGGRGQAAQVMEMYSLLVPRFAPLDTLPVRVALSPRGSWQVELKRGELIELGRGSNDEVLERLDRFVRSISRVSASQPARGWDRADLRHANGYALHLTAALAPVAVPTQAQ